MGKMTEKLLNKEETTELIEAMGILFPDAKPELNFSNPFELLIAVILSAQTTDVSVNRVTENLFKKYPTPKDIACADLKSLEAELKSIGLYRNKAKFIKKTSQMLVDEFDSQVPDTREALESLPGVGRKTANVVLSVAFNKPAIAVDTHVNRISKKFKIAAEDSSFLQVEEALMQKLPKELWGIAHHRMIFFGRYQCPARKHNHQECIDKIEAAKKLI